MRKGQFEKGNPGKPKGTTNLLTRTVKDTVLDVFNKLQLDPKHDLLAFAKNNPREFYIIAAKLIPTEVNAHISEKVIIVEIQDEGSSATVEENS